MKAALHTQYNKNNIELEIREVAVPTINEGRAQNRRIEFKLSRRESKQ